MHARRYPNPSKGRLDVVSPALAVRVAGANARERDEIVVAAVVRALNEAHVADPYLSEALSILASGVAPSEAFRARIDALPAASGAETAVLLDASQVEEDVDAHRYARERLVLQATAFTAAGDYESALSAALSIFDDPDRVLSELLAGMTPIRAPRER